MAVVAEFERSRGALSAHELADAEKWAQDAVDRGKRSGSRTSAIVDACVVEGALRRHDLVITSDPADLVAISSAARRTLEVDTA